MSKAFSHFKTITKHRHCVLRHCIKAGIFFQGLRHDLSKYTPTEFLPGAKYYAGTRSPNEVEREQKGYSAAWLHHKGRNRHHYEYWQDYNPKTKRMEPVERNVLRPCCCKQNLPGQKLHTGTSASVFSKCQKQNFNSSEHSSIA